MYRLIMAVFLVAFSQSNYADISMSEYNKCKSIGSSLKRLLCYDDLNKDVSAAVKVTAKANQSTTTVTNNQQYVAPTQPSATDGWQVRVDKDRDDFTRNKATASLFAVSSYPENLKPQLVIHCNNKRTRLYINWGTEIGREDRYNVMIDGAKFPSAKWNTSKNKRLTYYPKSILGLMNKMLEANEFSVEIELKDGRSVKAVFDITGINGAVEPIRYACEW